MTTTRTRLDCGCTLEIESAYDVIDEQMEIVDVILVEPCPLHGSASQLLELLDEWRHTPYFDNHSDWAEWTGDFGIRVEAAIAAATGDDNAP